MIDLGEAIARPKDRRRALVGAAGVGALSLGVIPVVSRPLGVSYPVVAIVVAVSIVTIILSSVLLWAQARVSGSVPLLVLAGAYGATASLMTPYLLLYRGLWPQIARWVSADPQTSAWLWFEWHLLFALTPIAYLTARRFLSRRERAGFERIERFVAIAMVALFAVLVPPAIWVDGLPPFLEHGYWTALAWTLSMVLVALAIASIGLLYARSRFRSALDVWLSVASLCMIADVVLSVTGAAPFSLGWYLSRAYVLVASGTVLTALILQTANVYEQLAETADQFRDESLTDALTGVANRRDFDVRLAQVLADGARMSRGAALLMIDIDNFKLYNDTFGHVAGDECLRTIASAVRESVSRPRDTVARFGGEELAVIMAETDIRGALVVGERVRSAIEALAIPQSARAFYAMVTVSIGATAVADTVGVTAETFLDRADRALYRAKQSGRNRVLAAVENEAADNAYAEGTRNTRGIAAGSRATIS